MSDAAKCPFTGSKLNPKGTYNEDWWTNRLDLSLLEKNISTGSPMDKDFDYVKEFETLDLNEVKRDIEEVMTTSQDWFPADYGNYGPLFIRMAWHSAGTYRTTDGRGGGGAGMLRFAPLNSWADNTNLDKARRILWSIKKKYGKKLSWADLMILAGNVALENMGLKTFGFSGGRVDVFYADDTYWGSEKEWLADNRYSGDRELENPLAAVQMGLIYVNPEGPNGNPDPVLSARDIRETFARMAMNDEETVALIAGGHTFGKAHGAGDAVNVGSEPEGAPIELGGLGWKNSFGKGNAEDTITSGIEGAWTATPTTWDNSYFETLFKYDWKQVKSPAGATQWIPTDESASSLVPDAHVEGKFHAPMMTTADLALKFDPEYEKISRKFYEDFDAFADAFARAWFKLTHRDLGPSSRYVGSEVPAEILIWQDPVPSNNGKTVSDEEIKSIKSIIRNSGLSIGSLVETAWASASTFRNTDKRGGANGARILLEPQKSWESNQSSTVKNTLEKLKDIQASSGSNISMADLIVLAGCVAIESATNDSIDVPFISGRTDATQEQTDVESFKVLEPLMDGFRNFVANGVDYDSSIALVDKALSLGLTTAEMVVLIAGIRSLGANYNGSDYGVITNNVGNLDNSVLVNLLDINNEWTRVSNDNFHMYDADGNLRWKASRVDLLLASNSQLRAIAEVYAADDGNEKFVKDFIAAWHKVMMLDRFDIK